MSGVLGRQAKSQRLAKRKDITLFRLRSQPPLGSFTLAVPNPPTEAAPAGNNYNAAIMMDTGKLFVFLTAAFLLAIAPGPGMLYVLARTLAGGKREGALSAVRTFVGGMVHVVAAAAGVSVILARSAAAFTAAKHAGAAYLCFLGIRMIVEAQRDAGQSKNEAVSIHGTPPRRDPFWQGVTTEVLNPKTALFFLSFIPQFVQRQNGHVFLQFLILGGVSVVMNTVADLVVTALAGPLGNRIRSSATFRRRQRTATGVIMVGLGTYLATSEK